MTSEVTRIGGLRPQAEVTGPLAEHAAAFKQMLIGQGYARGTISAHLGLMSRVSRWLDVQGLPARALADLAEVDRFFAERGEGMPAADHGTVAGAAAGLPAGPQVIGAPVVPAATPPRALAEYRTYLEQERAATAGTVVNFTEYAGIFLRTFPRLGTDATSRPTWLRRWSSYGGRGGHVVTGWASCRSPAYGQAMVYALRNLLRYLHARGLAVRCASAVAVSTVLVKETARSVRAADGPADGGAAGSLRPAQCAPGGVDGRDHARCLPCLGHALLKWAALMRADIDSAPGGAAGPREVLTSPSFRCWSISARRCGATCVAGVLLRQPAGPVPAERSTVYSPGGDRETTVVAVQRRCWRMGLAEGRAGPAPLCRGLRSCDVRAPGRAVRPSCWGIRRSRHRVVCRR